MFSSICCYIAFACSLRVIFMGLISNNLRTHCCSSLSGLLAPVINNTSLFCTLCSSIILFLNSVLSGTAGYVNNGFIRRLYSLDLVFMFRICCCFKCLNLYSLLRLVLTRFNLSLLCLRYPWPPIVSPNTFPLSLNFITLSSIWISAFLFLSSAIIVNFVD